MSQTQWRAKIGALAADKEAGTVGEICAVGVAPKIQAKSTGNGATI